MARGLRFFAKTKPETHRDKVRWYLPLADYGAEKGAPVTMNTTN